MAGKRPVFTENFSENLTGIHVFLGSEGKGVFRRLVDRLFDEVVPTLCRFPRAGRNFLSHAVGSKESRTLLIRLRGRLRTEDDLREFIMDEYLLLCLVRGNLIVFLSVKHHRQLSFDLRQFWQDA